MLTMRRTEPTASSRLPLSRLAPGANRPIIRLGGVFEFLQKDNHISRGLRDWWTSLPSPSLPLLYCHNACLLQGEYVLGCLEASGCLIPDPFSRKITRQDRQVPHEVPASQPVLLVERLLSCFASRWSPPPAAPGSSSGMSYAPIANQQAGNSIPAQPHAMAYPPAAPLILSSAIANGGDAFRSPFCGCFDDCGICTTRASRAGFS
jgi:hypothetical protein